MDDNRILYNTRELGHIQSSVFLSPSASCCTSNCLHMHRQYEVSEFHQCFLQYFIDKNAVYDLEGGTAICVKFPQNNVKLYIS